MTTARRYPTNEAEILREGERVLEERLGPEGYLTYLRLIGGGRDRFEDIRKKRAGESATEVFKRLKKP
jgi:hypothetical protein